MNEEAARRATYEALHESEELRFPLEDYPVFVDWLNVPRRGEGLALLDVACGQGFFLAAAERSGTAMSLHGVDFSPKALRHAKSRAPAACLAEGSAYKMPYVDGSFDYCVNLGSAEHFDQPELAMREVARVLKPTGKALIIVPNEYYLGTIWKVLAYGEGDDQGQEGVTQLRTIGGWRRLFLAAGLDVTGISGYNGVHHIAWFFRRPEGVITQDERRWRLLLDTFVKPLIPLNLAQCFVFSLRRQPE